MVFIKIKTAFSTSKTSYKSFHLFLNNLIEKIYLYNYITKIE